MKLRYLLILVFMCFIITNVTAQTDKSTFEVYGFVMADVGMQGKTIDPNWYDALRASKLPSFPGQFKPDDGKIFWSVRQSRLGVKTFTPTKFGDLTTKFEFDLFGVGSNVGTTNVRVRHFWGQLGKLGAGQTNSTFMDGDVFPNTLEYWGPTGMLFFRNIQIRYTAMQNQKSELMVSLEAPGGSGDGGVFSNREELGNVSGVYYLPDLAAHYRYIDKWGYVQLGGIVGRMDYRNNADSAFFNLNGTVMRFGGSLSSNIHIGKMVILRLQGVYGAGVQNYFNDAPVDVGLDSNSNVGNDPYTPVKGKAIPVLGLTAFADIQWNKHFSSSVGWSYEKNTNTLYQSNSAFKVGQYGAVNIIYYPVDNVLIGAEFLFARRDNKDGWWYTNPQARLGFKYNFSKVFTF